MSSGRAGSSVQSDRIAASALPRRVAKRLSRARVREIQREQILAAALETVEQVGYARMTVGQVIGRARVSRKSFYELFADREDCFLAVFDEAVAHMGTLMAEAYEREPGWLDGVRSALAALVVFLDDDPALAKLCVLEALGAGARVQQRRVQVLEALAEVIDRGRSVMNTSGEPAEITAEGVVGAIFAVLHKRLLEGGERPLADLLSQLTSIVVLPYLGASAASEELSRPAPAVRRWRSFSTRARGRMPLEGLDMRLTYRTLRVLTAIAERPGANNREVAQGAGVLDQGQISKLLSRLAGLELIENVANGSQKPNAWRLTERGVQLARDAGRRYGPLV